MESLSTNESLSYNYPDLASEWHPFLNSSLTIKIRKGKETRSITPHSVSSGSSLKVWWQCSIDKTHVFQETIDNRAKKESGCPYCRLRGQSKEELTLLFELKSIFNRINPNGRKILTARRVQSVDIFIDDLSLAIEYDGAYWHKGSEEKDRRKSKALKDSKIKLIRLRQSPLKKVSRNDIIVDNPFNAKRTVDLILNEIENKYELKPSTKKKMKKYVSSEDLSAISERDNYIESHLIRK